MTLAPRFGLFLSQANLTWDEILGRFELAEELGFDHAWLVDHLLDTDGVRGVQLQVVSRQAQGAFLNHRGTLDARGRPAR